MNRYLIDGTPFARTPSNIEIQIAKGLAVGAAILAMLALTNFACTPSVMMKL